MNTRNTTLPLLLTLVLAGIALSVCTYFAVIIKKKSEFVAVSEADLGFLRKNRDDRLTLKKTLQSTEAERDTLASYFVGSDTIVGFIESIEAFAVPTGTRLEITNAEVNEEKKTLSLTVIASGQFQNIHHLLRLLETMPVEISFTRLSLSKAGAGVDFPEGVPVTTAPLWNADMEIELISFGS